MAALEREKYQEAVDIFNRILVQRPASEFDLVVLYNSGAAYMGLGDCSKALERFRQVARSSAGKFEHIEGEALYRASLMYECLEQDAKAITSLIDTKKRAKDLPFEVKVAEIPARLAAAYARMGNRDRALYYFNQASRGLKRVVTMEGRAGQIERVSKTLYLMGKLTPTQRTAQVDPINYLRSLSMQQPYLLQAIEMGHPLWSKKAEEDLSIAYDNVWRFSIADPRVRRDFLTKVLQSIHELERIRMPKASAEVDGIFAMLDKSKLRIQNELVQFPADNPLTSEAEKGQSLRREGRLVSPENGKRKKK
jgi:tetratricopeptide (TPR) repeat protein